MKNKRLNFLTLALLSTFNSQLSTVLAQGTAFTYQGRLNDGANVANGNYDLTFGLFNVVSGAGQVGATLTNTATAVSNGLFTVTLDFGAGVFNGADRFLEIAVRINGGGAFTDLSPRQKITSTPYAITAGTVTGPVAGSSLAGTYSNAVTLNNAANQFNGTFSGNGAGVSNVDAATLGGLSTSNFWRTGGNAGTTAGVNFLGTTDNQPLELQVSRQRVLRLEPATNGAPNVIGGSSGNRVAPGVIGATIGGGGVTNYFGVAYPNSVAADFGTIAGGWNNLIQSNALHSSIGGGVLNLVETNAKVSTISAGFFNRIGFPTRILTAAVGQNEGGTIGGGAGNLIIQDATAGAIGGGVNNTILTNGHYAAIPGGSNNAAAAFGFAAGRNAWATNQGAFVWADSQSTIFGSTSNDQFLVRASGGVGIGKNNPASALDVSGTVTATSFSGNGAAVSNVSAAALGGLSASNFWKTSGNAGTTAGTDFLGTTDNQPLELKVNSQRVFRLEFTGSSFGPNLIGGSSGNFVGGVARGATIGGGGEVAGGATNRVNANFSTIAGGYFNIIQTGAFSSTIGGGEANNIQINADKATISGGLNNIISGSFGVVPGGDLNVAGTNSFAAGHRAKATNQGAFVWGDSSAADVTSTNNNSWTVRASGGVRFFANSGLTAGVFLAPGGTSWSAISDRNAKKNFSCLDGQEVLARLADMPMQRWNYKWEADDAVPHIGPMAQDFKAAFYPGRDDKTITTLEFDGVELAAIQGLNQRLEQTVKEKSAEIQELKQRLEALEKIIRHQKSN